MSNPTSLGFWDVYRGDAVSFPITDVYEDDSPVNLATLFGPSWSATARVDPDDTSPVAIAVDASNAATGVLVLSLTGSATAGMTGSTYYFDVQATGGALSPVTAYRGVIRINKDVTHG